MRCVRSIRSRISPSTYNFFKSLALSVTLTPFPVGLLGSHEWILSSIGSYLSDKGLPFCVQYFPLFGDKPSSGILKNARFFWLRLPSPGVVPFSNWWKTLPTPYPRVRTTDGLISWRMVIVPSCSEAFGTFDAQLFCIPRFVLGLLIVLSVMWVNHPCHSGGILVGSQFQPYFGLYSTHLCRPCWQDVSS